MRHVHGLAARIGLICMAALAAHAGDAPAAGQPRLYDVLGGASWSERRLEVTAGISEMRVDGVGGDQQALYVSGATYALSGYRAPRQPAMGGILGLGVSLKGWYGKDAVDVAALAPFALGVAGIYATVNERVRLELAGRAGPGLSWVAIDDDASLGMGWTWAIEGSVTVTKGDSAGLGVGVGYESVHIQDVTQDGPYLALRFAF